MNNKTQNGFMLLFIGTDWHQGLSPEQMQKVSEDWMAWFKGLSEAGKVISGHPLSAEGKVVSGKNRTVTDGPYVESKEAIGGYFMLDVATMEEAVAIAQRCPGLPYGVKVQVRPVLSQCPHLQKVEEEAQLATAK